MNSLNDHINLLKQQKKGDLIKQSDKIKEKLKYNKKESILRKFDDIDNDFNYEKGKNSLEQNKNINKNQLDNKKERNLEQTTSEIINPIDKIPKDKKDVILMLREKKQPITLFGETDEQRYNRLVLIELGKYDPEVRKEEVKLDSEEIEIDEDLKDLDDDKILFKNKKEWKVSVNPEELIENIGQGKRYINVEKFDYDFKSQELYIWCHRVFSEWQEELEELDPEFRKKAEGKQRIGLYRQCKRYIKPLLQLLKKREAEKDIVDKLFEVMLYCMDKDYVRAHDKYIELAIGNAPWPMGVTMVGIHERSGRSKIFTSQVAHILNDETQKRYLQSMKRLISVCQRRYPTTPSKSVFS